MLIFQCPKYLCSEKLKKKGFCRQNHAVVLLQTFRIMNKFPKQNPLPDKIILLALLWEWEYTNDPVRFVAWKRSLGQKVIVFVCRGPINNLGHAGALTNSIIRLR